jgi:hypothetical protein
MSYFLWIEDFASQTGGKDIAYNVLGGIIEPEKLSGDKKKLRSELKTEGVFIELNFGNGLDFIQNRLGDIDFIILDMNLPAYSGSLPNANVVKILEKWHGYKSSDVIDEVLLGQSTKELQDIAGYHLYTQLIFNLGFPENHILFCSNHGSDLASIKKAFTDAKIELPIIYTKDSSDDKEKVQAWVKNCYENPYSRLRRGIIEGCKLAKKLSPECLYFNQYIPSEDEINHDDIISYFQTLENFLPLREPENKQAIYKLFVRTLSHEWEAAKNIRPDKEKPDAVLAWIMRNTRHWITHNSGLFDALDEHFVAFLFMVNLRVMFKFDDYRQHQHESVLLKLFENESLAQQDLSNKTPPVSDAYLALRNQILDENQKIHKKNKDKKSGYKDKAIDEAFYFNEMTNNIQLSSAPLRHDKARFIELLYQTFWLTTRNPFVDKKNSQSLEIKFGKFNYSDKPYMLELARHIYHRSFPEA